MSTMIRIRSRLPRAVVIIASFLAYCAAQDGYEYFPNIGYYKLHSTNYATWGRAWDICNSEGGHLGIINSEAEAFVFSGLFARVLFEEHCFIGFHDMYLEGKYVTIFGTPLEETGYYKWQKGQPDNWDGDEDCGSIQQGGLLNDADCFWLRPFICEREIV